MAHCSTEFGILAGNSVSHDAFKRSTPSESGDHSDAVALSEIEETTPEFLDDEEHGVRDAQPQPSACKKRKRSESDGRVTRDLYASELSSASAIALRRSTMRVKAEGKVPSDLAGRSRTSLRNTQRLNSSKVTGPQHEGRPVKRARKHKKKQNELDDEIAIFVGHPPPHYEEIAPNGTVFDIPLHGAPKQITRVLNSVSIFKFARHVNTFGRLPSHYCEVPDKKFEHRLMDFLCVFYDFKLERRACLNDLPTLEELEAAFGFALPEYMKEKWYHCVPLATLSSQRLDDPISGHALLEDESNSISSDEDNASQSQNYSHRDYSSNEDDSSSDGSDSDYYGTEGGDHTLQLDDEDSASPSEESSLDEETVSNASTHVQTARDQISEQPLEILPVDTPTQEVASNQLDSVQNKESSPTPSTEATASSDEQPIPSAHPQPEATSDDPSSVGQAMVQAQDTSSTAEGDSVTGSDSVTNASANQQVGTQTEYIDVANTGGDKETSCAVATNKSVTTGFAGDTSIQNARSNCTSAATAEKRRQQSAHTTRAASRSRKPSAPLPPPATEAPSNNLQVTPDIYEKSYSRQQSYWKRQGQIVLNLNQPTPQLILPTASGSAQPPVGSTTTHPVPSSTAFPVQPTHIQSAPHPTTSTALVHGSVQANAQALPLQHVPADYPIIPLIWSNIPHNGSPSELLELLDAFVKDVHHLPSHIDGEVVTEARQKQLSSDLYQHRINLALINAFYNNASFRAMTEAARAASSSQNGDEAGPPNPAPGGHVPLFQCGWRLEGPGREWNEKCEVLIPKDEEVVKLHFQAAHRDALVWKEEVQPCKWGAKSRCGSKPFGTTLPRHMIQHHLGREDE